MSGKNPEMLIRIAADMQELKKNLAEGRVHIETTTAAMQKMASSLDGSRLEQRAHNIVAAISEIGGATMLTDAEAARHLKTLDLWVEKGSRLGREIPPQLLSMRDALVRVEAEASSASKAVGLVQNSFGQLVGAVSVAGLVNQATGALVSFARSAVASAGATIDMAHKTGLSTDTIQRFAYVASQTGSDMETFTNAAFKLGTNLAGNDKSVTAAVNALGLSFSTLRAQRPDEQFELVTAALEGIKIPQERNRIAVELFGKAAKEILPAIAEGYSDIARAAKVSGEQQLKALDDASDAWDAWVKNQENRLTAFLGNTVAQMNAAQRLTQEQQLQYQQLLEAGGDSQGFLMARRKDMNLGPQIAQLVELTDEQKAAAEAAKKHAEAIQQLQDKFSGADLARKIADLGQAMRGLKSSADFKLLAEDLGALFKQGANLTPEMIRLGIAFGTITPKIIPAREALQGLLATVDETPPKIDKVWDELNKPIPYGISNLKEQFAALVVWVPKASDVVQKFSSTLRDDLSKALQQIPSLLVSSFSGGGGLEGAVKGMGTLLGGTLGKSIGAGIKALGKFGGPIGEAIGSLAGPLMEKIIGMFSSAGRDAVKDFAATFAGGFDGPGGMHEALLKGGDAGEAMWIKITQGTPKGDAAAAARNIEEVKQFLADLAAKQKDVGTAATAAGEAQAAAMQKAKDAVSVLDDKIKSLSDSIANEAPEEVMGVIEQQTRAQIDAIKKQRDEAQIALDKVSGDAADAAEDAAAAIDTVLAGHDFRVKIHFDMDGLPSGASIPGGAIPQAEGGDWIVTRPTLFLAGEAGPERATFTPHGGAGPASGPVHVTLNLDSIKVLEAIATSATRNGLVR